MGTFRRRSGLNSQPNDGRRSFIWKIGAAMTTGLIASAVPAAAKSVRENDLILDKSVSELSERITVLEAEKSIIGLYHTYESLLNEGIYDKIPELFVADSEVVYNGGVFKGRVLGVTRLYNTRFRNGFAGKKMDTTLENKEEHSFELSEDHLFAKACFPFSIQAGTPMVSNSVFVSMARLHGEGINKWCENGVCELSFTRESKEGTWMIKKLEYCPKSKSALLPIFTKLFPADPEGPDALV